MIRPARRSVLALAAALALCGTLAACAGRDAPPQQGDRYTRDPVTVGHAAWCDSLPPMGYCTISGKR